MSPDGLGPSADESPTSLGVAFVVADYRDLAEADADYEALLASYADRRVPAVPDIVTIGRKASGEARFYREGEERASDEANTVLGRLAGGLAAALYPSVGADVPSSRSAGRAVLNAVAGEIALALPRKDLMELGAFLDASSAAVIVAVSQGLEGTVRAALTNARSSMTRSAKVDIAAVEGAMQAARLTA